MSLLCSLLVFFFAAGFPTAGTNDWPDVRGEPGGTRFSVLSQINRQNVPDLRVAWTYRTGDVGPGSTLECTPVVVEGVLYLTTVRTRVVALDAASGQERWRFDPQIGRRFPAASGGVNRGVAYWSDGRRQGERRILLGTADGRLISLDARTGRPDPAFGQGGEVDLRAGMERDLSRLAYGVTSAPAIFEDSVILGFAVGEGPGPAAPGDIRAFDVRTGRQRWRFHTVPRPGEVGHETWEGDSWRERGGANAWGGLTVDIRRGMLFAGLGSPAFDFYGGDRKGDNLFANCTLALDARTGRRLWHFQTVRHDLWDWDLPCPPVLCTVRHNGRPREAAAQVTKTGQLFLFDRVTGAPLFEIEERPVPASDVPGERAAATQPFPRKPPPFARQSIAEGDVTDLTPEARRVALVGFRSMRTGSAFTPPSLRGTLTVPGFHGGATWSGAAVDPTTGILYVNGNNVPNVTALVKPRPGSKFDYSFTGYHRFLDTEGYPAIKPPWGTLTAIDLNRGEFAWQIPFGEYPELAARGVPPTGCENFGGAIVTAGGLVFIGGTRDEKFHAYDAATGRLLWETTLPAGGYATPCTYAAGGRQFVVIAAGGGGKIGTRSGDAFVAFALSESGGGAVPRLQNGSARAR
jgi:quinoprotein glucose dehydrogenase